MSDPTAEAESVAQALRARGCNVVDVPQSMLVARVAVQRPGVILLDADGAGAREVADRIRQVPSAGDIHILFLGRPGAPVQNGLFVRPVDVSALVEKVVTLVSGMPTAEPAPPSVVPRPAQLLQPSILPLQTPFASPGPSLPPASMRAGDPSIDPGALGRAVKLAGIAPPVSDELQQLLADAEQRISVPAGKEPSVPTPDEEIEAVLPAELLASLDEALDEDEDDDDIGPAHRPPSTGGTGPGTGPETGPGAGTGPGTGRERTDGGSSRTTGGSTTGGGATPRGRAAASRVVKESVPPPTEMAHTRTTGQAPRPPPKVAVPSSAAAGDGVEAAFAGASSSSAEGPAPAGAGSEGSALVLPAVLGVGDATRAVAHAIALRTSASLCFFSADGVERRVVLRDGDIVTAASTAADETLLAFLGTRGDLPRETVRRLGSKFPAFGRHGGAALVAKGFLRQDQMWPTLRAHAEWVMTRVLQVDAGRVALEAEAPGRLAAEPNVFGGSSGASVLVDLVRRTVTAEDAVARLGGLGARLLAGPNPTLLDEAALAPPETDAMRAAMGLTLREVLDRSPEGDHGTMVLALAELGVFVIGEARDDADADERGSSPDVEALDAEAVRERVRARLQVVEDGDYFAVLGVARDATGYEVRRAYLELRRSFDAGRVLTAETVALAPDVKRIALVLDEAYEILKDGARRERYRRAIEASPDAPM